MGKERYHVVSVPRMDPVAGGAEHVQSPIRTIRSNNAELWKLYEVSTIRNVCNDLVPA